ncbi:uncharacterized protein LOC131709265 [Acipenser ruthenus]|uniref:uncharacterized protein LOC131709265 n=1 Tax=Acipenser ruthenus TaxID=7906 RepID=UPI0027424035|nr:uncharacterized protein LOC131709265 [Acipenser ruthenus]
MKSSSGPSLWPLVLFIFSLLTGLSAREELPITNLTAEFNRISLSTQIELPPSKTNLNQTSLSRQIELPPSKTNLNQTSLIRRVKLTPPRLNFTEEFNKTPVSRPVKLTPPTIHTIQDLRNINVFGFQPPSHGFALLWWLCSSETYIDINGDTVLRSNPNAGHYGFHHFYNLFDNNLGGHLLPVVAGVHYYTVGNLNPNTHPGAINLPYDVRRYYNRNILNSNSERLIISNTWVYHGIFNVQSIYITNHYHPGYEIAPNLVAQIRNLNLGNFLNAVGYPSYSPASCHVIPPPGRRRKREASDWECIAMLKSETSVQVVARNGKATLLWENIPWNEDYSWVGLYNSETEGDKNYIADAWQWTYNAQSGSYETSTQIHPGMQARLFRREYARFVLKSPGIDEACWEEPVQFSNDENFLILLVFRSNYAGVKLYVNKSLGSKWQYKDKYYYGWVGFYYRGAPNDSYQSWQWLYNFEEIGENSDYNVYTDGLNEYDITADLEVRVFCNEAYDCLIATTPSWSC